MLTGPFAHRALLALLLLSAGVPSLATAQQNLAEAWRVEETPPPPDAKTKAPSRYRVLTRAGRPISVSEGLGDLGLQDRITERVKTREKLEGGLDAFVVQRGVVFGVAGALIAAGVVGVVFGGIITGIYAVTGKPPPGSQAMVELPRAGPVALILGGLALVAGLVAVAGSTAITVVRVMNPPPPNPVLMEKIGGAVFWDPTEAEEVVKKHNDKHGIVLGPTELAPAPAVIQAAPVEAQPAPQEGAAPAAQPDASPQPAVQPDASQPQEQPANGRRRGRGRRNN